MAAAINKPVTKVIHSKPFSPLARADFSKPKGEAKPVKPSRGSEVKTPPLEEQEDKQLMKDIVNEMAPKEEKPLQKPTQSKTTSKALEQEPQREFEDITQELEDIADSAETELAFLSSKNTPMQKESKQKKPVEENSLKPSTSPEERIQEVQKELEVTNPVDKGSEIDYDISAEDLSEISLQFNRKYVSEYLTADKPKSGANIFLREVDKNTPLFTEIIKTYNDNTKEISVVSPFKFFNKQDFVAIFQKAFLGVIFDLNYHTPQYYQNKETHQIYLSSQIIIQDDSPCFILWDLIMPGGIYLRKDLNKNTDFTKFSVSRILLVSANILYL